MVRGNEGLFDDTHTAAEPRTQLQGMRHWSLVQQSIKCNHRTRFTNTEWQNVSGVDRRYETVQ